MNAVVWSEVDTCGFIWTLHVICFKLKLELVRVIYTHLSEIGVETF